MVQLYGFERILASMNGGLTVKYLNRVDTVDELIKVLQKLPKSTSITVYDYEGSKTYCPEVYYNEDANEVVIQ